MHSTSTTHAKYDCIQISTLLDRNKIVQIQRTERMKCKTTPPPPLPAPSPPSNNNNISEKGQNTRENEEKKNRKKMKRQKGRRTIQHIEEMKKNIYSCYWAYVWLSISYWHSNFYVFAYLPARYARARWKNKTKIYIKIVRSQEN